MFILMKFDWVFFILIFFNCKNSNTSNKKKLNYNKKSKKNFIKTFPAKKDLNLLKTNNQLKKNTSIKKLKVCNKNPLKKNTSKKKIFFPEILDSYKNIDKKEEKIYFNDEFLQIIRASENKKNKLKKNLNKAERKKINKNKTQSDQNKINYQNKIIEIINNFKQKKYIHLGPIQLLELKMFDFFFNKHDIKKITNSNAELIFGMLKNILLHVSEKMPVSGIQPGSFANLCILTHQSINYEDNSVNKVDEDLKRLSLAFQKENILSATASSEIDPIQSYLNKSLEIYENIKFLRSLIDFDFYSSDNDEELLLNIFAMYAQKSSNVLYAIAFDKQYSFNAPDTPIIKQIKLNLIKTNILIREVLKEINIKNLTFKITPIFNFSIVLNKFIDSDPEFAHIENTIIKELKKKEKNALQKKEIKMKFNKLLVSAKKKLKKIKVDKTI